MITVNLLQLYRHHVRHHSFQKHAGVQPHQWETDSVLCQSSSGQNHDWLLHHRAEKGQFPYTLIHFKDDWLRCWALIVLSLSRFRTQTMLLLCAITLQMTDRCWVSTRETSYACRKWKAWMQVRLLLTKSSHEDRTVHYISYLEKKEPK